MYLFAVLCKKGHYKWFSLSEDGLRKFMEANPENAIMTSILVTQGFLMTYGWGHYDPTPDRPSVVFRSEEVLEQLYEIIRRTGPIQKY
jgi:hypothetical protein